MSDKKVRKSSGGNPGSPDTPSKSSPGTVVISDPGKGKYKDPSRIITNTKHPIERGGGKKRKN